MENVLLIWGVKLRFIGEKEISSSKDPVFWGTIGAGGSGKGGEEDSEEEEEASN